MATTVRSVIEQALGLSLRNRRDSIANETVELVLTIQRTLVEAFTDAATVYPEYFGFKEVVAYSGVISGWARPSRALSLYLIENDTGAEVTVLQDRDREAERFKPSVIERGRVFYPGTTSGSPTAGNLTFYYSRSPVVLATGTVDQDVDSAFPDEFIPLLVYAVAVYFAQKDQRADELETLASQYGGWRTLWQQHLREATQNTRHRFAPRTFVTPETKVATKEAT